MYASCHVSYLIALQNPPEHVQLPETDPPRPRPPPYEQAQVPERPAPPPPRRAGAPGGQVDRVDDVQRHPGLDPGTLPGLGARPPRQVGGVGPVEEAAPTRRSVPPRVPPAPVRPDPDGGGVRPRLDDVVVRVGGLPVERNPGRLDGPPGGPPPRSRRGSSGSPDRRPAHVGRGLPPVPDPVGTRGGPGRSTDAGPRLPRTSDRIATPA
ncbi:hypothetical protein THAOC_01899, partial [Thalassiosira oceanica]